MTGTVKTAGSLLSDAASFATIVGAPLALLALIVGVATLRTSARTARLQHMHSLFKDYLRLQFEYAQAIAQDKVDEAALRRKLGSFKMYTLEEMHLWLRKERGLNWRWLWGPFRRRHIKAWEATIAWHLDDSSDEDFAELEKAQECYSEGFLKLVKQSQVRRASRAASASLAPPPGHAKEPGTS